MSEFAASAHDPLATIFPGDSEMACRMRAFDWSASAFGPTRDWPENLRVAIRLCLTSRFPICLWWARPLRFLYNDAFRPWLSDTKHSRALMHLGREVWSEDWHIIGPMLERVIATGEASWSEDTELYHNRKVPQEEVYITWSFTPILAADGHTVDGIFCPCSETTEKVIGARRLETLRKLAVRAGEARTVDRACDEAAAVLGENMRDVPFVAIYVVGANGDDARLSAARLTGEHRLPSSVRASDDDAASPWPLAWVLRTKRAADCLGIDLHGVQLHAGPWRDFTRTALVVPIHAAQEDLAGLLVVGVSPRRPLDAAYRTFFDLVAGHIATAISGAQAYEAQRERAEALAQIDRAKTAFFSNVSHEFRTPLTLMLSPVEDALADAAQPLPLGQRERLETVHRSSLRLLKLVNTLLEFSRIEAGRVQAVYEPTDLAAVTTELVSNFRSACDKAGLRLTVDCPPMPEPVYVDRDMWEKIVLNLVSNAFKFTLAGMIEVCLRTADASAQMSVRDTGIGIPAEELPRVFERFHRVEGARGRTYEGTGIGLALVHELVKLHGGSVRVDSTQGAGSTFLVSVPLGTAHLPADRIGAPRTLGSTTLKADVYVEEALRWLPDDSPAGSFPLSEGAPREALRPEVPAPGLPPGDTGPAGARAGRPHVLWADDNADMRDYVRRLLGERYDVEAVADGEAALAAARARPPDLVLADVMMPRLDGFGLLRALRGDLQTRAIPVILLSARAGEEASVEGLRAGADDYIVKPFGARELLARVSGRLEIARLTRHALTRQQQMRKAVLDGMADRYYAVDAAWRYTEFNAHAEAHLRMRGKDPAKLIGELLWDEFRDPSSEKALREAMCERRPTMHVHYDEPLREWVENRIYPAAEGGIAIFQRYVTESKRLEEQLRRTAAYLADAEALSHTGTWAWNPTTGELFWSAEHFRIFGLEPESVTPTYDVALGGVHPDDRLRLEAAFVAAVAERRPYAFDCRIVRPDGEIRYTRSLAHPVFSETGQLAEYVGTIIDLTERVRADEALRRSQQELAHLTRVLSLAALTASIGHDLSQFVVAIETTGSACLRWLAREPPDLEQAEAAVRRIMRDAGLVGDVVGNMRAFLRKTARTKTELNVADVIREARLLIEAEAAKHDVAIDESIADSLPPLLAVRVELQQVLLNLMLNAIEAMAEVSERPRILRIHAAPGHLEYGRTVVVSLEDSGPGLAGADSARLFDAFYTTKSKGLGMGLSIARSIIEDHGGRLWAMPNPQHGVTLRFTIPVTRPS